MKFQNPDTGERYDLNYWDQLYSVVSISKHGNFVRETSTNKAECLNWLKRHGAVCIDTRERIL